MDMLLAAAMDALARPAIATGRRLLTPTDENDYYARHTLNIIVPAWLPALITLLRRNHRTAPERIGATRHA
ncbi:hypothetical protein ASC89_16120 [Devosia sp. Root413D1]|uniref:hypothetical protein n=1 Tax=Devosia sp. Root413D1 TaxID=1736531 RepID=UPI0006F9DF77|nr:hypothetical protein [Devosia sp. Root413D1]KQW78311.1 hypothetical protein ASC89_16120 [Devosia sp. Root413D1]